MKKRNDEDIKKALGKLPSMEDHQSKEMLYQKVSSRVNTPKRKAAPWLFPGIATLAVLVVLAVFIPVLLSNNGMMTVEDSTDRMNENAESSTATEETSPSFDSFISESEEEQSELKESQPSPEEGRPAPEEKEEGDSQENESNLAEKQEVAEPELESLVLRGDEEGLYTVSYPGKNAEVILPTVQMEQGSQAFSPENYGLAERAVEGLEYEVDETENSAIVTFPDGFSVSGSAWASAIIESIRWDLENYPLQEIHVQTESGNPVSIGSYGEVSEIPVIQKGEYIFQLYQFEDSAERLLVPVSTNGPSTIQDALSLMKENGRGLFVSPAVPEHVQFPSITVDEALVEVNIQHQSWASEQQLLTMIEAILATAGQFGYEKVKFNGINVREFSTYNLAEPIDVPKRINPVFKQ